MDANLRNILLGVLFLTIGIYILKNRYDGFSNPGPVSPQTNKEVATAHEKVPEIDQKAVQAMITGIKNVIKEKPETILVAKQVIADPTINATLYDILSSIQPPEDEGSSFGINL